MQATAGAEIAQELAQVTAAPDQLVRRLVTLAERNAHAQVVERILQRALGAGDLAGQIGIWR
jgi:hypothetical protein